MKDILRLIETIHDKPHKLVMSVAGAGIQTVTWLLGVSGASRRSSCSSSVKASRFDGSASSSKTGRGIIDMGKWCYRVVNNPHQLLV